LTTAWIKCSASAAIFGIALLLLGWRWKAFIFIWLHEFTAGRSGQRSALCFGEEWKAL